MSESDEPRTESTPALAAEGPPPPAPEVARRRSASRWLIIGGIALVFLLIIGYVLGGAAAAGGPIGRADSALHTAVGHNNETADSFKGDPFSGIDLKSDTPDIPGAKTAVANEKQKLSKWQALISSDRTALQQVRPDLKGSLLTLPEQGTLDRHRQRVDAALSALTSAQKAVDLYSKELAFLDPFLDAVGGFVAIGKAGTAQDIAGIKAQLPGTGASIQKAIDLSQPPAIPAELGPTLKAIQQVLSDIQALVTAVEANDAAAIQKYATAVEAEGTSLSSYDGTSLQAAIKALYQPLSDAYDRDMKIAAGN
jgi:hypothetical protein